MWNTVVTSDAHVYYNWKLRTRLIGTALFKGSIYSENLNLDTLNSVLKSVLKSEVS